MDSIPIVHRASGITLRVSLSVALLLSLMNSNRGCESVKKKGHGKRLGDVEKLFMLAEL